MDSLATYDATEAPINLGLGATGNPPLKRWLLPADPGLPSGAQRTGSVTTAHVRTLTFGAYTGAAGARTLCLRFTVDGTSGNQTVVFAWGVHLASETIWGAGNGASQYTGPSRKARASLRQSHVPRTSSWRCPWGAVTKT